MEEEELKALDKEALKYRINLLEQVGREGGREEGREGGRGGGRGQILFPSEVGRYGCQNDGLEEADTMGREGGREEGSLSVQLLTHSSLPLSLPPLPQERDRLRENVNMRALVEYRQKATEYKKRLGELDAATDIR